MPREDLQFSFSVARQGGHANTCCACSYVPPDRAALGNAGRVTWASAPRALPCRRATPRVGVWLGPRPELEHQLELAYAEDVGSPQYIPGSYPINKEPDTPGVHKDAQRPQ